MMSHESISLTFSGYSQHIYNQSKVEIWNCNLELLRTTSIQVSWRNSNKKAVSKATMLLSIALFFIL
jgi:hypothetical protein